MALSEEDIRKEINDNPKGATIARALYHEGRVRFHTEICVQNTPSPALSDFFAMVSNLLPDDKVPLFKSMLRWPLKTNGVTGEIYDRLFKVFDGRNAASVYQFGSPELRDDWDAYRTGRLHEPEIWRTKGWEVFRLSVNSVMVVDLPEEPNRTGYPEPYFYFLPIGEVMSYRVNADSGNMDFLIFRQPGDRIAVIDDASYRIYQKDNGGNIGVLLSENVHGLGYCPARFFWQEPVSPEDPDVKASAITRELGALDWFLFFATGKRNLDLFGAYPIYSGYRQDCGYEDESGCYCDGGFLRNAQGQYMLDPAGSMLPCPKCKGHRIVGAGSFVDIPVPTPDNGNADLRNPVQVCTVDRDSLDYNVQEEERLRREIIASCVGSDSEIVNDQAVNEAQVDATYQKQNTVLQGIKRGFENAQKFVDETVCRLRYGSGFLFASVNYGDQFYRLSADDLREKYKAARDSGASEAELDALQSRIIEEEHRNSPIEQQRMRMLADLEPMRHSTRSEVLSLLRDGMMTRADALVKLNFSEFIRRFERENVNILDFGDAMDYSGRIEKIRARLYDYASEKAGEIGKNTTDKTTEI